MSKIVKIKNMSGKNTKNSNEYCKHCKKHKSDSSYQIIVENGFLCNYCHYRINLEQKNPHPYEDEEDFESVYFD